MTGRERGEPEMMIARDARTIGANQKLRFFPVTAESGSGCVVVESGGRRLLDLSAAWGANSVGHAHPAVVEAVAAAAARGGGSSVLSTITPEAVGLAEELLERVPAGGAGADRRVILGHSGTDANNTVLSSVRAASGRTCVVAFNGGYHGGFGPAQRVSGVFVDGGSVAPDADSVMLPYPAACGDPDVDERALRDGLAAFEAVLSERSVAAVIVESHQSDGGIIVPPAGFLAGLAQRAHAHGALLVCDEVKVGLGRTGRMHGYQYDDVIPDIVTFGKALGGGLPLSAVVGPSAVLDAAPASSLLTTAGNSVSAAAGRAVLRTIENEGLVDAARERGAQLVDELTLLRDDLGDESISDIRGRGLSLGVELADPEREGAAEAAMFVRKVVYRVWQLGAICYLVRDNVIELTPPLTLDEAQASRAVELIGRAIRDVRLGEVRDQQIAPYLGWE